MDSPSTVSCEGFTGENAFYVFALAVKNGILMSWPPEPDRIDVLISNNDHKRLLRQSRAALKP